MFATSLRSSTCPSLQSPAIWRTFAGPGLLALVVKESGSITESSFLEIRTRGSSFPIPCTGSLRTDKCKTTDCV